MIKKFENLMKKLEIMKSHNFLITAPMELSNQCLSSFDALVTPFVPCSRVFAMLSNRFAELTMWLPLSALFISTYPFTPLLLTIRTSVADEQCMAVFIVPRGCRKLLAGLQYIALETALSVASMASSA